MFQDTSPMGYLQGAGQADRASLHTLISQLREDYLPDREPTKQYTSSLLASLLPYRLKKKRVGHQTNPKNRAKRKDPSTSSLEQGHLNPEPLGLGPLQDLGRGGHILDGQAVGLEEGDLVLPLAPGQVPAHHLAQLMHLVPGRDPPLRRPHQVARLDLRILELIHDDPVGPAGRLVIHLASVHHV